MKKRKTYRQPPMLEVMELQMTKMLLNGSNGSANFTENPEEIIMD